MAYVVYHFIQGGHPGRCSYECVSDALYSAVSDLHANDVAPVAITWQGRVLLDRAAITRVWQACRAELVADPWHVPANLEAAGRQELEGKLPRSAP